MSSFCFCVLSPAAECHHVTMSSMSPPTGATAPCFIVAAAGAVLVTCSCHFRARRGSVRDPGVTLSPSPHPDLSSETRGQMWHLGSDVCHLGSPPDLTSQICHLSWPLRGHTRCHIRAEVTRADQQLGTLCPASVLMLIGEIKIKLVPQILLVESAY